jgi:hypothetical protein
MPEDVSSLIGKMKPTTSAMGDNYPATQAPKLQKKGEVYVEQTAEGATKFYPAKHYEANVLLAFDTEEDAVKANGMSAEEASRFLQSKQQAAPQQQAPTSAMAAPNARP